MRPLRLALLRADDHDHRYLESTLRSRFDLSLVVVEPEPDRIRALRRQGRYRDWAYHRYHRLRRAVTGADRYRRRYFAHSPQLWAAPCLTRQRTTSVNDLPAVEALRATPVDVVVVAGCAPLSHAALEAAGPLVVRVHAGMLPYYGGDHGIFFAVYDGRPDRAGSTIHRLGAADADGELVEVVQPVPHDGDRPDRLDCRAELLAVHRLVDWLEALERGGELASTPPPQGGRTFRVHDRGPSHDLRLLVRRCARRLGLTRRPVAAPQSS